MGRKHLKRMMAKKVPGLIEIFQPQWTSGIFPIVKKMIVPGLCLNYNQTQGHQRECSKGSQRERADSYEEKSIRWAPRSRIWRGDTPCGEGVRLPRRDKNWNPSDTCREMKGEVPEVSGRGCHWRIAGFPQWGHQLHPQGSGVVQAKVGLRCSEWGHE